MTIRICANRGSLNNFVKIWDNPVQSLCILDESQSCVDSWIKKVANGQTYNNFEKHNIKIVDTKKCQQTIENIA